MPLYEVRLKAFCAVAVEAATEEEATERAWNEVDRGDFEIDESETDGPITDPVRASAVRRHAEKALED